jgi:hypothetical protein
MELALDNNQGEWSPLFYGIHALECVELGTGGRGKKGGLRGYAEQIGRSKQYVAMVKDGAEVVIKLSRCLDGLLDKVYHLSHIHGAPSPLWPALVEGAGAPPPSGYSVCAAPSLPFFWAASLVDDHSDHPPAQTRHPCAAAPSPPCSAVLACKPSEVSAYLGYAFGGVVRGTVCYMVVFNAQCHCGGMGAAAWCSGKSAEPGGDSADGDAHAEYSTKRATRRKMKQNRRAANSPVEGDTLARRCEHRAKKGFNLRLHDRVSCSRRFAAVHNSQCLRGFYGTLTLARRQKGQCFHCPLPFLPSKVTQADTCV